MKRNSELLKLLAKCKPELRKAILKATEEPQGEQPSEEAEPSDEIETDIMDSVPATMKSRARQLIKKLKSYKDLIGWNEQGQVVFKGRSVPSTNIVDLVNDTLRQRKNFNPDGWELFSRTFKCTRRYCEKRKLSWNCSGKSTHHPSSGRKEKKTQRQY